MIVVIFRATTRALDADYASTAERMRTLAFAEHGCLEFHAVTEGDQEVALSYWPDEAHVLAWRRHLEHQAAQQQGRLRWYASYRVEVARIERSHRWME